jgi:asparagine synthase (glutamine-hydrolysing)
MFDGIKKLPAGCYLKIDETGFEYLHKYWDVFEAGSDNSKMTEQEIKEKILEELKISVQYRKISDVPVGIFLSGGIDSSVNAMLFSSGNKEKINTFTIGYKGNNESYLNEFYYARKIAKSIDANHHEKILKVEDFINFLNDLVFYQDEPIGDPVCFPIYHVSKLAKDNGVTVCQVGEGSDELFMGYPNWKIALNLYNLNNIPFMSLAKNFLLKMLEKTGRTNRYSYEWLRRAHNNEPIFWGGAEAFFEPEKNKLLSENLKAKFRSYSSFEAIKPILNRFNEIAWEKEPLQWMSYLDLNLRLPELLLMRVDKMSMATSLEARVPFLDHKFVEFIMSLSQKQKINRGELKYIFKKSVKGLIPDEILFRKKQGFGVPLYEWFLEELGDFARKKLLDFTKNTDYFNKSYLEELFIKKSANKIWNLLNFVLWHEKWIG